MSKNLGKVVKQVQGYRIRIMLAPKEIAKKEREFGNPTSVTKVLPNGKIGVYTGKKLIKELSTVNEAIGFCNELLKIA